MARQGADAVAVRLGSLFGQPQAQLDGFKSRALRSEASTARHLYLTEWRSLDAGTLRSEASASCHLYLTAWRHIEVASSELAEVLTISDEQKCSSTRLASRAV